MSRVSSRAVWNAPNDPRSKRQLFRGRSWRIPRCRSWRAAFGGLRRVRRQRTKPLLEKFKIWLEVQLATVSRKSTVADAIRFGLGRCDGLVRFLDDGRIGEGCIGAEIEVDATLAIAGDHRLQDEAPIRGAVDVAWPEERPLEIAALVEHQQRVVAVTAEVSVSRCALLSSMGWALGNIHVENDVVGHWSLTTLSEKLVKIGTRIVHHGRYVYCSWPRWYRGSCSPRSCLASTACGYVRRCSRHEEPE